MMELPFELWDNCDLSTDRASYNALVYLMISTAIQHPQLTNKMAERIQHIRKYRAHLTFTRTGLIGIRTLLILAVSKRLSTSILRSANLS